MHYDRRANSRLYVYKVELSNQQKQREFRHVTTGNEEKRNQLAIVVACTALFLLAAFDVMPIMIIRSAACVTIGLQVYVECKFNDRRFLISPNFWMGAVSLIFFSSLLAAFFGFIHFAEAIAPEHVDIMQYYRPETLNYFGSMAERIVVCFALANLALHGLIRETFARTPALTTTGLPAFGSRTLFALSILLSLGLFATTFSTLDGTWISRVYITAYLPIQSFLLMWLLAKTLVEGTAPLMTISAYVLTTLALLSAHQLKLPFFIALGAGLVFFMQIRVGGKTTLKAFTVGFVASLIFMIVAQEIRFPHMTVGQGISQKIEYAFRLATSKIVYRQVETAYCLHQATQRHSADDMKFDKQLFWIAGLIPRAVWPQKPSLSLGQHYAVTYCGLPNRENGHSSSITLLGQPIVMGGANGVILHGGLLVLMMGGLTWATRQWPGLGVIFIMSLMPWWIDFDQDFALYIANLVKFALFIVLSLVIFKLAEEAWRRLNAQKA